jgi:uncharacterized protein
MLHYYAGTCHYQGFEVKQNASAAISHFGQAAELGHAKATSALGMMVEYGVGVSIDRDRAINLYRQAAEDGELFAAGRLAYFETMQDIELHQGSQSDAH